jgi:hypothetical protein
MERKFTRAFVIAILMVLFTGMIVHYSYTAPQNDTVRQSYEMLKSSGEHIGETVYFWSGVSEVSSNQLILGETKIVNVTETVQPGDGVQVYGTIKSEGKVVAERVIVIESESRTQLFIVSAIGILFGIATFLRSWSIDIYTLTFVPRESEEDA